MSNGQHPGGNHPGDRMPPGRPTFLPPQPVVPSPQGVPLSQQPQPHHPSGVPTQSPTHSRAHGHPFGPGQPPFHPWMGNAPLHGRPPGRRWDRNTVLIALIVVMTLLGAGGVLMALNGGSGSSTAGNTAQPIPTSTAERTVEEPRPTPVTESTPGRETASSRPRRTPGPNVPEFPDSSGDYTRADEVPGEDGPHDKEYKNSNGDTFFAAFLPYPEFYERTVGQMVETEIFGDSVCGKEATDSQGRGFMACYTKIDDGILRTAALPDDTPALIGNPTLEFLAAWK